VRWPPDHPAETDPALSPWRRGASELCPDAQVVRVLRHVPGRRVATLVRTPAGRRVVKVFASPRARGNQRRLAALAATDAGPLVPRPLGADRSGHVGLVDFVPGASLRQLEGERLTAACALAGHALRRLHASGARLDRTWSIADEARALRASSGPRTRAAIALALELHLPAADALLVCAHRDFHPAQAVLNADGRLGLIDLDDAAMAPPALDVGNFLAHLAKDAALDERPSETVESASAAFLDAYGDSPPQLARWTRLSLARLAGLAETRHRDRAQVQRLLDALAVGAVTRARVSAS
jgi:Ser/Thr protein kinase RdoA (MazF antagonist)